LHKCKSIQESLPAKGGTIVETTPAKTYFDSFREVVKAINSTLDLREVLDLLVSKVTQVMDLKACAIRLLDSKQRTLELLASQGLSDAYIQKGSVDADRSIAEAMEGKIVVIKDAAKDSRAQYQREAIAEGIVSIVSVPLQVRSRVIGVLRLYSGSHREFSEDELNFAEALAEMGAIAIENAKMYERIKKDYESVMSDVYNFVGYRRSI
jgi:signal transduction protein with GAF and PtsI domain